MTDAGGGVETGNFAVRSVAVLGLGLVGGSLARDLAARGVTVLGYDHDPAAVDAARREGVVRATIDESLTQLADADVVVLAVPVTAAPALLVRARPHLAAARLVTDVGSTKRTIVACAERLGLGARFVGSHPMAGDHRAGWGASRAGLFAGATTYLCPAAGAGAESLALAHALWTALGARPEVVDAAAHDARLALTSHLPQLASTLVGRTLAKAGVARAELGPGGRDVTRLAGSSPEVWAAIAIDNAAPITSALRALEAELRATRAAIERGDAAAVLAVLRAAQEWFERDAAGGRRHE
jgi:prephenate dehydrogenase